METLQSLVEIVRQSLPKSVERRKALTRLLEAIRVSNELYCPGRYDYPSELYHDALQNTFLYIARNIDEYDPSKSEFLVWVNHKLDHAFKEEIKKFNVDDTLAIPFSLKQESSFSDGAFQVLEAAASSSATTLQVEEPSTNTLVFKPETKTARYFTEQLSDKVGLDMIWVPGGEFDMGSADDDSDSNDNERPQHRVVVSGLFMGCYPITQSQWRAVAAMPQHNQKLNPDPAYYKGEKRPVESITWYDATEFCDRLSNSTGRTYRLPSEAEWEYACRAHTTTPFHFGSKLTSDLANFDNSAEEGVAGTYEGTTPFDTFTFANGFGLADMHGNVLEWCLDNWHDNYEGAPTDGRAWLDKKIQAARPRVLRGGAWDFNPKICRSAYRDFSDPRKASDVIGFRVVCVAPRALA